MPRGRPRKVKVEELKTDPGIVSSGVTGGDDDTYSCGCPVVPVDETRNKKKCIVHGVE